jgi:Protein of unknown function (DUF2934)
MPKKTVTKENAAVAPVRAAKPKTSRTAPVVEVASKPRVTRVKSVTHSKTSAPAVTEVAEAPAVNAYDQIAKIAFGYWEARGCQHGSAEQDWLYAEQEYLRSR